jgi:hypothetical protein
MRPETGGAKATPAAVHLAERLNGKHRPKLRSDTMFRKLILSAALATGTLTGLSLTSGSADAHPPAEFRRDRDDHRDHRGRPESERFEVLYSRGGCWENGGTFRNRFEADRAAEHFRCDGYQVQVRGC